MAPEITYREVCLLKCSGPAEMFKPGMMVTGLMGLNDDDAAEIAQIIADWHVAKFGGPPMDLSRSAHDGISQNIEHDGWVVKVQAVNPRAP